MNEGRGMCMIFLFQLGEVMRLSVPSADKPGMD